MNGDDFPRVPRRRAVALALRDAVGWSRRVTELLALFFAVLSLTSAVRIALGVEYDPFSLQEAATTLGEVVGTLAAFLLLGRLPWDAPRTLLALAAMPAATAVNWLLQWEAYGNMVVQAFWLDLGRTLLMAALLFPVVYLIAGTLALVGAVAGPNAYLGEDGGTDRKEG